MPELGGHQREHTSIFVVGIIVGAIVIGLAWLAYSAFRSGDGGDSATPAAGTQSNPANGDSGNPGSAQSASAAQVAAAHAQSCAAVFVAQSGTLQAADAALQQWEVHVGAMNKLVTGVITLHQANQFWNSTRVGAWANLKAFSAAKQRYDQRADRCPQSWATSASANQDVRRCRAAVAARNHTLRLAATALHTWKGHVKEMDMLRAGKMSPQMAQTMWLQSWAEGNKQVQSYTAAEQKAQHLHC